MPQIIDGYTITASNASKLTKQRASITIRASTGDVVARVYSDHSQPLKWARKWPHSAERLEIKRQLLAAQVDRATIERIVSL